MKEIYLSKELLEASGPIDYPFTNDYMFKIVLEQNKDVLVGLVSSLLHIDRDIIKEVNIENPIVLGEQITSKTFVLDIKLSIHNGDIINLEMQVYHDKSWANRSLSYLCRNFDKLQRGEDYMSVNNVTHIGILAFDLFPENKEFYSTYMMSNVRSHHIFNSKFKINVLSLKQIENATDEDKRWHIDEWARLFSAKTWEELRMVAEKNQDYARFSNGLRIFNEEYWARENAERRDYEARRLQRMQDEVKGLKDEISGLKDENADLKDENADLKDRIAFLEQKLASS